MSRANVELILKNELKFTQLHSLASTSEVLKEETINLSGIDYFGGIIKKGQLAWLARGSLFEVFSLENGRKISSFCFDLTFGFQPCIITSVAEIDIAELNLCILAICMQFRNVPGGVIALCAVELSKIFRCIEVKEKITSCHYISKEIAKRTILQIFNGCLAIGTDNGNVILVDLNFKICEKALYSDVNDEDDTKLVACYTIRNTTDFRFINQHYQHSKLENVHFGIEINVTGDLTIVLSILPIINTLSMVIGLEDGRLALFDFSDFQLLNILNPPLSCKQLPLVKLTYIEPTDDPRACIYLLAFHEGQEPSLAFLYSLTYEKKIREDDEICLFENFQSCSLRLALSVSEQGGIPIACQSIFKRSLHDNEDSISLFLLALKKDNMIHLHLFDMNQWYKEQMPDFCYYGDNESYLASFSLKNYDVLDIYIVPSTLTPFNSIRRLEEYFYPISLNFDCVLLHQSGCTLFQWPGLQNRALEHLKSGGSLAILEPTRYFNEIMQASLMPQYFEKSCEREKHFSENGDSDNEMEMSTILQDQNITFSVNDQRSILLSVALEYNYFGLLKECASCWADGSHLGKNPSRGLSLSTLTDWIWKCSKNIKKRCNQFCVPLFDHSDTKVDFKLKNELSHLLRQLKLLADLMETILKKCQQYIPNEVNEKLLSQYNSIRLASNYQEIVQWLLNIGLLPEGFFSGDRQSKENKWQQSNLVPYPFKILKNFYATKRKRLGQANRSSICNRTGNCRILYIDAFIEHECNANVLRDYWIECGGNGLYPPPSLQAMLRVMLIPEISIESKYVLLIYLFLDLNTVIESKKHAIIVQNLIKFPSVFKLNASLIKTVQAFWNLDHEQFELAIEELISPFLQDRKLSHWQKELLIETLLTQDQHNLALQALQAPSAPVSSLLELKILLSNGLVAEAFHLQKTKNDPELFRKFLRGCLCLGKLGMLRDLTFTEEESKILEEFLKEAQSLNAKNLYFVYLLQKLKYIEAMSYLDKLLNNKLQTRRQSIIDLDTPNLILTAYNSTMTPATKQLTNIYYEIRDKIKFKNHSMHLSPLSSDILQQNVNKSNKTIFESLILNTNNVTTHWDETTTKQVRLSDIKSVPFVRSPQFQTVAENDYKDSVSYPEIYKGVQKRKLNDNIEPKDYLDNPLKRRRITGNHFYSKNLNSFQELNASLITKFKEKSFQDHQDDENIRSCSIQNFINKTSNVLSTPIVKSIRTNLMNENESGDERACTPQSILKSNSRSKTWTKNLFNMDTKESDGEKLKSDTVKSIRFEMTNGSNESERSDVSDYNKYVDIRSIVCSKIKKRKSLRHQQSEVQMNDEYHYSVNSSEDNLEILEENSNEKFKEHSTTSKWNEITKLYHEQQLSSICTEKCNNDIIKINGPKPRRALRSDKIKLVENSEISSSIYNHKLNLFQQEHGDQQLQSLQLPLSFSEKEDSFERQTNSTFNESEIMKTSVSVVKICENVAPIDYQKGLLKTSFNDKKNTIPINISPDFSLIEKLEEDVITGTVEIDANKLTDENAPKDLILRKNTELYNDNIDKKNESRLTEIIVNYNESELKNKKNTIGKHTTLNFKSFEQGGQEADLPSAIEQQNKDIIITNEKNYNEQPITKYEKIENNHNQIDDEIVNISSDSSIDFISMENEDEYTETSEKILIQTELIKNAVKEVKATQKNTSKGESDSKLNVIENDDVSVKIKTKDRSLCDENLITDIVEKPKDLEISICSENEYTKEINETNKTNKNAVFDKIETQAVTDKADHISSIKEKSESLEQQSDHSTKVKSGKSLKKLSNLRRARSESIEQMAQVNTKSDSPNTNRLVRAKSVSNDTVLLTPHRVLTRRQSALLNSIQEDLILQSPSKNITPTTPNKILTRRQSALLSSTEENSLPESFPNKILSSKSADLTDDIVMSTPNFKRNSRRSSVSSEEISSTLRNTRSKSILSEDSYKMSTENKIDTVISEDIKYKMIDQERDEEKPKKMKKRKLIAIGNNSSDEEEKSELQKSVKKFSTSYKTKKFDESKEKEAMEHTEQNIESDMNDYLLSKRLTRSQHALVLVKNITTNHFENIASKLENFEDQSISDCEAKSSVSIKSKKSGIQTRRRTRSSSLKDDDDEISSVDSTTSAKNSSKRDTTKRSKSKNLKTIKEEGENGDTNEVNDNNYPENRKKRGRSNQK